MRIFILLSCLTQSQESAQVYAVSHPCCVQDLFVLFGLMIQAKLILFFRLNFDMHIPTQSVNLEKTLTLSQQHDFIKSLFSLSY